MKKISITIILLVLVLGTVAITYVLYKRADTKTQPQTTVGKMPIAATIFPLYDIARIVGGEYVDPKLIVPVGASPHLFTFSPKDVARLEGVRAVFTIGYGLDDWMQTVTESLSNVRTVRVDEGIPLRSSVHTIGGNGEGEDEGPIDPHYYLSLENAQKITRTIARTLSELDPAHAHAYAERADAYVAELEKTRMQLQDAMASYNGTPIITLHDAWYYFAHEFGLRIVAAFEPVAGEEPTPKYLEQLKNRARAENVQVIFSEPQLSNKAIQAFAQDYGLRIATLDPEGGTPAARDTFIKQMRYNVDTIIANLE